jgi:acyl-CoA reductase-like NAD-dependent aldehyde dehydrogenase
MHFRGRSYLAFVVTPETPINDWLTELDKSIAAAAGFFSSRPVVLDLSGDLVRRAVAKGAKALLKLPDRAGTPYLPPEVLTNVDHGMALMTEETFGPAVGIQPVKDDEEAIRLMNDSRYGLTASIWTQDEAAALRIGDAVETGTWYMNRCDYLDPALAWTGVKDSGRGCTLTRLGFEAFTRPKSFHLKLQP